MLKLHYCKNLNLNVICVTVLPPTGCGRFLMCFVSLDLPLDFAVGAPFQDSGKVYIWMGGKSGITKEPSQVQHNAMRLYETHKY